MGISDWDIYLVTDANLRLGRSHSDEVIASIAGGVKVVQFREKQMNDRDMFAVSTQIRSITMERNVDFILNNRVDIALAVDADGVHVGQEDMPAPIVRRLIGPDRILGVSATTVSEALKAEEQGANYVSASPIFSTSTKKDAPSPTGLEGLRAIARAISIPVIAIGGINLDNLESVVLAGADVVAVVSAIVCAENMTEAAAELSSRMRTTKQKYLERRHSRE